MVNDVAGMREGAVHAIFSGDCDEPNLAPTFLNFFLPTFMGPRMDSIFAKSIARAEPQYAAVSIGLWRILEME